MLFFKLLLTLFPVNCWPNAVDNGQFDVNVEYELLQEDAVLSNVVISIPINGQPTVHSVDGEYVVQRSKSCIEWQLHTIDASNRTGVLEMTVAGASSDAFFPVTVEYASEKTYVGLELEGAAMPDGTQVPFSVNVVSGPEDYRIV